MSKNQKKLSHEEHEELLDRKIQVQQQRINQAERTLRMLGHKSSEEERRIRTHRLLQLGAVVDQWLDREGDPQILSEVLVSYVIGEEEDTLGKIIRDCYMDTLSDQ